MDNLRRQRLNSCCGATFLTVQGQDPTQQDLQRLTCNAALRKWKCHAQKCISFFGPNFHRFDSIVNLISFTSNCGRDSGDGRKPGVAIGQLGLQVQTGAANIQPQRLTLKSLPRNNSNFQTSRFLFKDDSSFFQFFV